MDTSACYETHPVLLYVGLPILGRCRLWSMYAGVFMRPDWTATLGIQCLLQETCGKTTANRKTLRSLHSRFSNVH